MRWVRRATAGILGPPTVIVATLIGTIAALIWSPPGRALTARLATDLITASIAGRVEIGAIRGSVLNHLVLENVRISDSTGALVIAAPRLEVRYLLPELFAGRIVFSELRAERPVIHLRRSRANRWNYEEVFRIAKGDSTRGPGKPPQLVALHDVTLRDASIRIDVPTTPKPPKLPVSRNAKPPAQAPIAQGADGPVRVYQLSGLNGRFPLIRISTPQRDPILIQIAELRVRINEPAVTITSAEGELLTAGDSLRFTFRHADMAGSSLRGGGAVRWPHDTLLFDFTLDADTVDLVDLRWISPDFPDWQGKGKVVARSISGSRTDYTLTNMVLGDGRALAVGRMIAAVDKDRGLGLNDLDLALRDVPLEVARPYLDTLPLRGTITGRLRTNGFFDRMTLGGDVVLTDALVPGTPNSRFVFAGVMQFGSKDGAVFERFRLTESIIDLGTVRRLVPSMVLPGTIRLTGQLDGPWLNARFDGRAEHVAPNAARSRMNGSVRFDARQTLLGLALDADFDAISFDALRTGYPALKAQGSLVGRVTAIGPLDDINLLADLTGEIGAVRARGRIGVNTPRLSATGLVLDIERLDLRALLGRGTRTALNGRIDVTGVIDTLVAPEGRFDMVLGPSRVGGMSLTSVIARANASGGLIGIDTASVTWPDGRVDMRGSIGYAAPDSGSLMVVGSVTALTAFDSLVRAATGITGDSVDAHVLAGAAQAELVVSGSLDDARIAGTFSGQKLRLDGWHLARIDGRIAADSFGARGVSVTASADSFAVGARLVRDIEATVSGVADSLAVAGKATMGLATVGGGGEWLRRDAGFDLQLDSLSLLLPRQQWQLGEPARLRMKGGRIDFADTMMLRSNDGSGLVSIVGAFPGAQPGALSADVVGLELSDIFGAMYSDTLLASGIVSSSFRLGGTRDEPTLRGNASITGPVIGDVKAPLVRAAFDYTGRQLRSNVSFWRTGEAVLEVDLNVPYDLALASRPNRRLAGPIDITASADSVELAILEAFTTSIRSTRGAMQLDLRATGTWAAPRLDGSLSVFTGRTTIPALGVRYGPIEARARFTGDSLVIDTLLVSSDEGDLNTTGSLRFAQLTSPRLDLRIRSDGFLAVNVPGFMRLRPTGDVTLVGPLLQPVMRGTSAGVLLTDSDIYFADLVLKRIINLEDPANADLVDTVEVRRQGLGAQFQSRFLDSLRIEDVRFRIGSDVWLKSAEANIQLEGELIAAKAGKEYELVGNLNTPRGTYTLKLPGLTRDFDVIRGSVRYYGTSDLNASLDVLAQNVVRTADGDEVIIQVQIGGTILNPSLKLSAPGRNIPDREVISYILFGKSEFQVSGAGESQAVQLAIGAAASELERLAVSQGLGVETIEFRPGINPGQGTSFSTLAVGRQFGERWFVTGNVGVCLGAQSSGFSARNFGASVEYRFARDWRLQASADPVQACSSNRASNLLVSLQNRYQLGADLLWEREYK